MAGKIPDSVIEEIKLRVDIVEIIGAYVPLKKSGSTFKGNCPFHQEKTPSFHVMPTKQFYHCFGCGESGNVFQFLMKQTGQTFFDVVRSLAERVGVNIEVEDDDSAKERKLLYTFHAELAAFYVRCLKQLKSAQVARDYLTQRGIPSDIAESFGIGFAPATPSGAILKWGQKYGYTPQHLIAAGILAPPRNPQQRPNDYYDRFKGRLLFPICDPRGRVVAFSARVLDPKSHPAKYINSPETLIFTKGRTLYGLDKAAAKIVKHPRREAILCEGQIDVIRCHASGFDTAVASQGTALSLEHTTLLKRYADCIVLAFDGDAAGRKAALRAGALLLAQQIPVRVAHLPPGSDPDSLLRDKGSAFFRELLENALSITAFQIATLQTLEERPDSIDAVARVTRSVLDMLSTCPSAILRGHLLQEAATLLNISISALESDLSTLMLSQSQRSGLYVYEPPEEMITTTDENWVPDEDVTPFDAAEYHVAPPPPPKPPQHEYLLCEFLIEHEQEEEILTLVARHLPITLLTHTFMRSIVAALLSQHQTGQDELAALQHTTPPEWLPLLERLISNPQKMLSARDITKEQAIRELIKAIWIIRLKERRGALSAASSPENDKTRLQLTTHIKRLETQPWEQITRYLTVAAAAALTPEGNLTDLWD